MSEIRPLERGDLPDAAALFERVAGAEHRPVAGGLVEFFERALFDQPWADPELPSLVAIEDGRIAGFLGSHPRRLRLDGRPLRLAVSGHLVVDPRARHPALGALLARRYLDGPQHLTITDAASEVMRAIWERLGGETAYLRCIEWVLPLRPVSLAAAYWRVRRGERVADERSLRVAAMLDRLAAPAARSAGRLVASHAGLDVATAPRNGAAGSGSRAPVPVAVEPLTAAGLVEHLPALAYCRRLAPAYDLPFAQWLLDELGKVRGRGTAVARLVRRGADVAGCYVYFLQPGGLSLVVGVVGADETSTAAVLDALVEDARAGGAAAVYGRVDTDLLRPVAAAGAFMAYGDNALIHGRDPALVALATSPHALLTRLEGERWMTPHLLRRTPDAAGGAAPVSRGSRSGSCGERAGLRQSPA